MPGLSVSFGTARRRGGAGRHPAHGAVRRAGPGRNTMERSAEIEAGAGGEAVRAAGPGGRPAQRFRRRWVRWAGPSRRAAASTARDLQVGRALVRVLSSATS